MFSTLSVPTMQLVFKWCRCAIAGIQLIQKVGVKNRWDQWSVLLSIDRVSWKRNLWVNIIID